MKFAKYCILLGAFTALSSVAQAQQKIGIVNNDVLIRQLPEAKAADEELTKISQKYRDTIETMQKDFMEAVEKYKKGQGMMTSDAKAKEEERLQAMQAKIQQYQEDKFTGVRSELNKKREEFLAPLRKKIEEGIKAVAKDESLQLVLDSQAALYFDDKLDITFRVIDKIKRGESGSSSTSTPKKK